jgi:hypothetical protein
VKLAVTVTKLPVVRALLKPTLAAIRIVSTIATHPALAVQVANNVVRDTRKSAEALYDRAVEAVDAAKSQVTDAINAATEFVSEHKAFLTDVAVSLAVGIGCTAAIATTGPVGVVACGALAGAAGSIAHDLVEGGHSWQEIAGNSAIGAAIGAIPMPGLGAIRGTAREAVTTTGRSAEHMVAENTARNNAHNLAEGVTCNSFTPDAQVVMADGSKKPISQVRVGDQVVATDPTTGKTAVRPVTELIVGYGEKKLVELTVDTDGDRGDRTATIVATDAHPFWIESRHEWVNAADLNPGALLQTSAGTYVQITAVRQWTAQHQRVYNLTVDGTHTYYVVAGTTQVLVHNCGGSPINPINTNAEGIDHTLRRHFSTGEESAGKSLFDDSEVPHQLAAQAEGTPFVFRQDNGRVQHVVPDAGREIGVDRATGNATRTYTVVTEANGDLVTMFPGLPGSLGTPIRCSC